MSELQAAIEQVRRHATEIEEYLDFGEEVVAAAGLVCNAAERVPALELDAARYRALREQDWDGKALATVEHGEWVPPGAVAFDDFADALRGATEEPPT